MNIAVENLKLVHRCDDLNVELKTMQDSIRQLEKEILELKENPETQSKENAEQIKK